MAQRALLIGIKETLQGDKITLIEAGDPREIRQLFKGSDGKGFDQLEVFESSFGRSRKKRFKAEDSAKPAKGGKH